MDDASQLLAMLNPAVRPGGVPSPSSPAATPIETDSFANLLKQAAQQKVSIPAEDLIVSKDVEKSMEQADVTLSPAQWQAIADATARAEREGSAKALVQLDGMAWRVNVGDRKVQSFFSAQEVREQVITHIDSAVVADAEAQTTKPHRLQL